MLLILYSILNLVFDRVGSSLFTSISSSAAWATNTTAGWIVRVALAMLVSILATLHIHGEQIRANLMDTNTQLEELISRIRRETWFMHRSVSLAVHGTVQSALISTAMRLTASDRTPATVGDARRRLEESLQAVAVEEGQGISLELALEDLRALWSPLVDIRIFVAPFAIDPLLKDHGLRRCVIEICREATSNAIRHGKAKTIDIRIDSLNDLIEIRISDDGIGTAGNEVAGLGSQMLDEICVRWTLAPSPARGSELIALLA